MPGPGKKTRPPKAIAYEHIARKQGPSAASTDIDTLKHDTFFGREKENLVFPIALANLVLHGIDQPNLWHGNTLTGRATYAALFEQAPGFFDYILTNPPFGGKIGKKTPLILAHFGFHTDGSVLTDAQLPANLVADWKEDEANVGKPFPSYASLLQKRGTPQGESRYSWTVDFAARRTRASDEIQPLLDAVAGIKAVVVDLKEQFKRLKKGKTDTEELSTVEGRIREKEKAASGWNGVMIDDPGMTIWPSTTPH